MKSRDNIGVDFVTYSTTKFTYDYIPQTNRRDESALTEESQPSRSSLPAEKKSRKKMKKGKTYTMQKTDYNYDYYEDHLHCERSDRATLSTHTAYRSTRIRWSTPMTNSDLFG